MPTISVQIGQTLDDSCRISLKRLRWEADWMPLVVRGQAWCLKTINVSIQTITICQRKGQKKMTQAKWLWCTIWVRLEAWVPLQKPIILQLSQSAGLWSKTQRLSTWLTPKAQWVCWFSNRPISTPKTLRIQIYRAKKCLMLHQWDRKTMKQLSTAQHLKPYPFSTKRKVR